MNFSFFPYRRKLFCFTRSFREEISTVWNPRPQTGLKPLKSSSPVFTRLKQLFWITLLPKLFKIVVYVKNTSNFYYKIIYSSLLCYPTRTDDSLLISSQRVFMICLIINPFKFISKTITTYSVAGIEISSWLETYSYIATYQLRCLLNINIIPKHTL